MQSRRCFPRLDAAVAMMVVALSTISTRSVLAEEAEARFKSNIAACFGFREFRVAKDEQGDEFLQVVYGLDISGKPDFERELEAIRERLDYQGYHLHYRWYAHTKDGKGRIREFRANGGGALIPAKFKVTEDSSFSNYFGESDVDEVTWTFTLDYYVIDKPRDNPSKRQILSDSGIGSQVVTFARSRDGEKYKYSARILDGREALEKKVAREELAAQRIKAGIAKCISVEGLRASHGEDGTPVVLVDIALDLSKDPELERKLEEINKRLDSQGYHLHYSWVARAMDSKGRAKVVRQGDCSALMPSSFKGTSTMSYDSFYRGIDTAEMTWEFSFDFYMLDRPSHLADAIRVAEATAINPRKVKFTRSRKDDKFEYAVEMLDVPGPENNSKSPSKQDKTEK